MSRLNSPHLDTGKAVLVFTGSLIAIILMTLAWQGIPSAQAQGTASLQLTPITWSVLGIDSTNPNQGPNEYPVGARLCNQGAGPTASGLTATFAFSTNNTNISLASASATQTFPQLAANACRDIFYVVRVTRSSGAIGQTRPFTITVTDGSSTLSMGQELEVKPLTASPENETVSIDAPTSIAANTTARITVVATAGDAGYQSLQHFLTLCPDIFRVESVDVEYSVPSDTSTTTLWADGCGWNTQTNDGCTTSPTDHGGEVHYLVDVTAIGSGQCTVRSAVYGFDGASYLYNSDYGQDSVGIAVGSAQQPTGTTTPGGATQQPTATATRAQPTSAFPTRTPTPPRGTPGAATNTPVPGTPGTATNTPVPGALPETGYRLRPGTLAFSEPVGPYLNSNQVTFTWLVIITLAAGVVLALWSVLVFTGVFSREAAFAYTIWKGLTVLFVLAALSLIGLLGYNVMAARQSSPVAGPQPRPTVQVYRPPEIPATQLIIPDLDIDTELTEAPVLGPSWDITGFFKEIAHLEGTAFPGTTGNAVLAGHVNTTQGVGPFWNLKALQPGNMIIARGKGIEYRYQVEWVKVVEPDDVSVIEASDEPMMTLISCANWDSASWRYLDRLVVRAKFFDRARTTADASQ